MVISIGSKAQELEGPAVAVTRNSAGNSPRLPGLVLIASLIAVTDFLIWRAAIGSLILLIGCVILTVARWRRGHRIAWLMLGVCTLVLSFALGLVVDKLNEAAARQFAAKIAAYKSERGVYPPEEIANRWSAPLFGYTQRYTLAEAGDARVWFARFNHRLQAVAVATGQLQDERDQ